MPRWYEIIAMMYLWVRRRWNNQPRGRLVMRYPNRTLAPEPVSAIWQAEFGLRLLSVSNGINDV